MMEIIIGKRRTGRTTQLIKKSANTQNYIVCANQSEASYIASEAKDLGLSIPFPLTYTEFLNKQYNRNGISGFLIDNVERLVEYISIGVPVLAITVIHPDDEVHKSKYQQQKQ